MIKLVNKQGGNITFTAPTGGYVKEVYWENILNKPFGIVAHFDELIHDHANAEDRVKTNSIEYYGQELYLVKVGELPAAAEEYIQKLNSLTTSNGLYMDNLNEYKEK